MKVYIFLLTIVYLLNPTWSYCEELTPAKKEAIKELIQFYKTPLGRKLVAVTPNLAKESIKAEKLWAQQILGPKFEQRVSNRFHKEGIKIDK